MGLLLWRRLKSLIGKPDEKDSDGGFIRPNRHSNVVSCENDVFQVGGGTFYLEQLLDKMRKCESPEDVKQLLNSECKKRILELDGGVRYRHRAHNIINMLTVLADSYIKDLKIVNDLGLKAFPQMMDVIEKEYETWIVTYIPRTENKDLTPIKDRYGYSEAKKAVSRELEILEEHGYLLEPTFRFNIMENSTGDIILPDFHLLKVSELRLQWSIVEDIYTRYRFFDDETWSERIKRSNVKLKIMALVDKMANRVAEEVPESGDCEAVKEFFDVSTEGDVKIKGFLKVYQPPVGVKGRDWKRAMDLVVYKVGSEYVCSKMLKCGNKQDILNLLKDENMTSTVLKTTPELIDKLSDIK